METASASCCEEPPKEVSSQGILHRTAVEAGSRSCSNALLLPVDGSVESISRAEEAGRLKCAASATNSGFDTRYSSFWSESAPGPGLGVVPGQLTTLESPVTSGGSGYNGEAVEVADCTSSGDITVVYSAQLSEEEEENAREWAHKSRRIALFVEPSPFAYVCGYKNRYQNFIRYLRELGDEVLVVTTNVGVPAEFYGAKVIGSWSLPFPWYKPLSLSLALSPRIYREVANFKPDIIHASSPGIMVFGALVIAKLLSVPMVMAYHTHVPMYIPKYTSSWLVTPMWLVIKFLHRAADLTLVMSHALGKEMNAAGASTAEKIRIWQKGVDSDSFHPRFKSQKMRNHLTDGVPDTPLIVHVRRLGAEKNLDFLKKVMGRIPHVRLAFVGDGPFRSNLEQMFQGMNVTFTGMLQGEELSQAYASADIFITPSESETLGFVVLEAMASGVSVVAARAGGIPDIVTQDGETGFLYTPGDLDDCLSKIMALLESSELRQKIGAAGRAEVEKFDWRASTRQVRNEQYSAAIWCWRRRSSWQTDSQDGLTTALGSVRVRNCCNIFKVLGSCVNISPLLPCF